MDHQLALACPELPIDLIATVVSGNLLQSIKAAGFDTLQDLFHPNKDVAAVQNVASATKTLILTKASAELKEAKHQKDLQDLQQQMQQILALVPGQNQAPQPQQQQAEIHLHTSQPKFPRLQEYDERHPRAWLMQVRRQIVGLEEKKGADIRDFKCPLQFLPSVNRLHNPSLQDILAAIEAELPEYDEHDAPQLRKGREESVGNYASRARVLQVEYGMSDRAIRNNFISGLPPTWRGTIRITGKSMREAVEAATELEKDDVNRRTTQSTPLSSPSIQTPRFPTNRPPTFRHISSTRAWQEGDELCPLPDR